MAQPDGVRAAECVRAAVRGAAEAGGRYREGAEESRWRVRRRLPPSPRGGWPPPAPASALRILVHQS